MSSERVSNVIGKNVARPYHQQKDKYGHTAILKMSYGGDYPQGIGHINESEIGECRCRQNISHLPEKHPKDHQYQRQYADTCCIRGPSLKRSAKILHAECVDSIKALAQEIKPNRHFNNVVVQFLLITERDAEVFMDSKHGDQSNKSAIT